MRYLNIWLSNYQVSTWMALRRKTGLNSQCISVWILLVFRQIANSTVTTEQTVEINSVIFEVLYFKQKNTKVPAIRFGYRRDTQTKGRTFVSVFHDVMGYLEKTLKIDSELDLSCNMVAFPQRFMYVSPCDEPACNHGILLDGKVCKTCNGTGQQQAHKGTQDIITLTLPTR